MPENIYGKLGSESGDLSGDVEIEPVAGDDFNESVQSQSHSPYKAQMMRSNIFLVVLFVGAAATVYGLSLRKGPEEASAEQKTVECRVDSAILRIANTSSINVKMPSSGQVTGKILKTFYDQIAKRQIPLRDLKKNPFVNVPAKRANVTIVKKSSKAKPSEKSPQEISREKAMTAFKTLHLQSVMMGRDGGKALISGNLLAVGQTIEGFKIKSISPRLVVLVRDGIEFTLEMP